MRIRLAELADAEAIRSIYNVEVLGSTNTFVGGLASLCQRLGVSSFNSAIISPSDKVVRDIPHSRPTSASPSHSQAR